MRRRARPHPAGAPARSSTSPSTARSRLRLSCRDSTLGSGGTYMNLNSVLIGTEDAKRLTDYYTKIFGKPSMEDSGFAGWKIGDGWINVGPHSEIKGKNTQPGRILLNIESNDVKGDFAKLKAAGAKVVKEPYRED